MNLWPHQTAAIDAVEGAIGKGRPAGVVAVPTGGGKSVLGAALARDLGWPTLVMIHRDELARQWVETFSHIWPDASVGIIQAERDEWQDGQDVVVASVPSLHSRRLERMPADRFGLTIVDECHHAPAPTWAAVLDHFDARFVLGLSATPERADGRGLADRFGREPLYSYGLRQAIEDGRLVRLVQYAIETDADLDGVTYRAGDFADADLSKAVNTEARNRVVVESFQEHAANRRAIAFTVDCDHAADLARAFTDAGVVAATVTGTTPRDERRDLLARFAAGDIRVMANVAVLSEGFDDPGIDAILMTRPTCSRGLYQQAIGRALRLAPSKTDALILDFVDNSRRHKLVSVLDLLGAVKLRNADGQDVIESADADRAEAEQLQIVASTRPLTWRLAHVCPWPEMPSLNGYAPTAGWHDDAATDGQLRYLATTGLDVSREITKGEAHHLIDRAREYDAAFPQPATSKQGWFLRRVGAWRAGLTKREASTLIGQLKRREAVA